MSSHRRAYIDVARGLAVLLMIEAHTLDAWTRDADRSTIAFRNETIIGGFAAPLFLWLAGVGLALSASRTAQRTGRGAAADAVCRRGLEIFLLAFLFRLQAFLLTPGGPFLTVFRVDILNVMGPAIAAAGLLWAASATPARQTLLLALAAAAIGLITPIVRASALVDLLPVWLQWYVRPAGDLTTFTLFPWAGFVFAGAAVGVLVSAAGSEGDAQPRVHAAVGFTAILLIGVGFWAASRPTIYHASAYHAASFWTTSPTWFAIRLGVMMLAFEACYTLEMVQAPGVISASWMRLAVLGRASLFIYWIHVELVYGYASWLWRRRLPLWGTGVAFLAFCALMYGAVVLRDRVVKGRRRSRPAPLAVSA